MRGDLDYQEPRVQIREATKKIDSRSDLSRAGARAVMEDLLSGSVADSEIISFLVALRDGVRKA